MNAREAIKNIEMILEEATSYEHSVCYVTSCDGEALKMAIEALEKQNAKKVNVDHNNIPICPSCKEKQSGSRYCGKCGQKLKWW